MSRWENKFSRKSQATSRSGVVFGDFAGKMEARGAGRTHAQTRGKIRQRDFWHGMVLQSKAHFEKRIVSRRRMLAERARQFDERHGVGKRINRRLMHCAANGRRRRAVRSIWPRRGTMLAKYPIVSCAVCLVRLATGVPTSKIIESAPFGERDLERAEAAC